MSQYLSTLGYFQGKQLCHFASFLDDDQLSKEGICSTGSKFLPSRADGQLMILHPFQQYFIHIRMIRVENERLCAMEPCLQLRRLHLKRGLNSGLLDH